MLYSFRCVGLGALLLGLGSLIFAMPHFIADSYKGSINDENICHSSSEPINNNIVSGVVFKKRKSDSGSNFLIT